MTDAGETGGQGGTWPVSWSAVREEQLRTWRHATPTQRLMWLEEALRLAFAAGALDDPRYRTSPKPR